MTTGDDNGREVRGDDEARARAWLRVVAIVVVLFLLIILVVVDIFGRLFVDHSFHVDPVMFGSLLGAFLILVGVEGASRLPWSGGK
jgi:hypothetical protein